MFCECLAAHALLFAVVVAGRVGSYEQGSCATVAGVHARTIRNEVDGTLALDAIKAAIRPVDDHFPTSRLVYVPCSLEVPRP